MTINKILRWVVLAGLFIIPFIPLLVTTSTYFPFITGKNFAFRVIVEIILAAWIILALRDKNYRPKKSFLLYAVLALMAVTGIATIFGENPYRSFWSNYERMSGYFSFLHLGAYFLVLISVLKKEKEWFWLANTALSANGLVAVYSFLQLAGRITIHQGGVRLDATLGNAAYLAAYLLFNTFIALYLLSRVKINWVRVIYGLTALVDLFLLYHTATRGVILGLLAGTLVFAGLIALLGDNKRQRLIAGGVIAVVMIFVGGFWLIKDTSFIKNSPVLARFASISLSETTTKSRFLIWNMSGQGFTEHPVLGWGPDNYSMVFNKYYDPKMWNQEPWFDRSHNIFFDWLIDAGLLGLLAYLSVFAAAIYSLWQNRKKLGLNAALLTGLLAAYFFQNIFVFDNLTSYLYFFAIIAFIHFVSIEAEDKDKQELKNKLSESQELSINIASVLVILIFVGCLYYCNYRPWTVAVDLIRALNPYTTSPEQGLVIFKEILNRKTFGSGEAREQLINKTIAVVRSDKVSNDLKMQYAGLVDQEIKNHLAIYNSDARSYLLFGSYLSAVGREDEGISLLNKALELSPKKQQIMFELASAYMRKQDAANTVKFVKQAYELEPSNTEARKVYALVALMTKQFDLAKQLIEPIKNDPVYFTDDRFLQLYQQMGDTTAIKEINDQRTRADKK